MISVPSQPVVIFGAGGLAREVAWTAGMHGATLLSPDGSKNAVEFIGHLDDRQETHGTEINGHPVLGGSDWLEQHPGHAVLVAVGKPAIRQEIVQRLRALHATFPTLLAPNTVIGDQCAIGQGVIALPGVVITTNVTVGEFVLLNPQVSISHDGNIGDYCSMGPGVHLAGNVHVGSLTDIGTGASAIPGSRIGTESIIGAGACVVRDVPDYATAVGVPAVVIKRK